MSRFLIAPLILSLSILSGCATDSANMRVGTSLTEISLKDQREAAKAIAVSTSTPSEATIMGKIDASRCHRNAYDKPPTNETVISDLKMAAYARGADGIADINIYKKSALLKNCWYSYVGEATMYSLPKGNQ